MSVIVDILSRYLRLGNRDRDILDQEFTRLDMARRDVDRAVSPRGGVSQIWAGNVEVNPTAGVVLINPHTGKRSVRLDPDGDAYFGQDIDMPSYTSLAIFSNAQSYSSESMGTGDVLLGDNTSGRANLLWDRSAGQLKFRGGTTVHAYVGTDGKVYAGSGAVVLSNTGITATAGTIGGWTLASNTLSSGGGEIVLQGSAEEIRLGTPTVSLKLVGSSARIIVGPTSGDTIILDGLNQKIETSTYASGLAGFHIDPDFAEFGNIKVRGAITSSIFVKGLIEAKAGSLIISKSAGVLHSDMVVPDSGTWPMTLDDPPGGGFLFDNGDYCRCKSEYASGVGDIWFTVASRADNGDGTQTYTCTYGSGTKNITYPKGAAVNDYGTSGSGYLYMTADNNAGVLSGMAPPFYSIRTWATNPWTSGNITERLRLGNLYGSYGAGSNNRYGIGIGNYSSGNYLAYNNDGAGTFTVKAGNGVVRLDNSGLAIEVTTSIEDIRSYKFYNSGGTTVRSSFTAYEDAGVNEADVTVWQSAGKGSALNLTANSPGSYNALTDVVATNASYYSRIRMWAGAQGYIWLDADDVFTTAWADYASASTITGWTGGAPGSVSQIYYKKVGKLVFVQFRLDGTNYSGTSVSFTLPENCNSSIRMRTIAADTIDAGTRDLYAGGIAINASSNIITIYREGFASAWTAAAGQRACEGEFWYQSA